MQTKRNARQTKQSAVRDTTMFENIITQRLLCFPRMYHLILLWRTTAEQDDVEESVKDLRAWNGDYQWLFP